jgi:hypothetical protein
MEVRNETPSNWPLTSLAPQNQRAAAISATLRSAQTKKHKRYLVEDRFDRNSDLNTGDVITEVINQPAR